MMSSTIAVSLLATLGVVSAHTIMQAVGVDGKQYGQGVGIYMPSDDSFQSDVTSDSMACNGAPVTSFTSSSEVIPVMAGSNVTGSWLHTLTSTGADGSADNKVIDSSHKGPVMAYMKKVSDASQSPSNAAGDGWFKVAEAGLISSNEWAVDALIAAGGVQTVKIPECIEDGDYLLRFEVIALHSASTVGEAQFYMECAQLSVTGGSGATTPDTVAIPGVYSATDPGIEVMIYNNDGQPYPSSYAIPGPEVFTCGSDVTTVNQVATSTGVASATITSVSSTATATFSMAPTESTVPGFAASGSAAGGVSAMPSYGSAGYNVTASHWWWHGRAHNVTTMTTTWMPRQTDTCHGV